MPIPFAPDRNLQKYLSKSNEAPRPKSVYSYLTQEYQLIYVPFEFVEMPSLLPSLFSISAFSSIISSRKQMDVTSFPPFCTEFWQSKKTYKISAMLRTTLMASLEMVFCSPNSSVSQAQYKNTREIYELNTIGLQSLKGMECFCDGNGSDLYGIELEREEIVEEKGKAQVGGSRQGKKTSGQNSRHAIPKLLLAGAVSTIISRTFVAPLERLKLEYIVRGAKDGWMKVIHFIWASEGFAGFWKGNALNLFRMVPFKSINFLTYDMYCNWLLEMPGKKEITNYDRLVAGSVSGIAATMLCLPMDTIRTRLVAPGGEALGGVIGCFQHMVCTEGYLSLYKGLMPTLLSMVPAGAVFYGVYDILKAAYLSSPKGQEKLRQRIQAERETQRTLKGDISTEENNENSNQMELGPIRTLVYGAIAGACAEAVTYPLEVVRRHLQLQETSRLGLLATFNSIIERDGASALFAGIFPSTIQVLPSAALSYLIYEFMKVLLRIS
eukprot:Gb_00135 [translate_table: standard]